MSLGASPPSSVHVDEDRACDQQCGDFAARFVAVVERAQRDRLSVISEGVRQNGFVFAVVLFDLDGVVRHFDPRNVEDIEARHGIAAGAIERFAFSSPLIERVTTGRLSRRDWVTQIAEHLGNRDAAAEWGRQPFRADLAVLSLADELRALGLRTAILTNGTDTIPAEAAALGLDAHFDEIFNSASIGFAKPDQQAFQHVLDRMAVGASTVFFTDDSPAKLTGAADLGMTTHLYMGVSELKRALLESGIPLGRRMEPSTEHPDPA